MNIEEYMLRREKLIRRIKEFESNVVTSPLFAELNKVSKKTVIKLKQELNKLESEMNMKKWTILEERSFYTKFKDGSEAEIEMDIEGDVSVIYGEPEIENVKFTNIKLFAYPGRDEFTVKNYGQLMDYIPADQLKKIQSNAEDMLIEYACQLERNV